MKSCLCKSVVFGLAVFLFWLKSATVNAQNYNYQFRHLTTKSGLPYPDINCLIKDKAGYVWIGTDAGLIRFDGTRYEVFKTIEGDSTTLGSNKVTCLLAYSNYIICGVSKYVSVFNVATGKFKNYPLGQRVHANFPNTIVSMLAACDHNIWMGAVEGIYKFNLTTGRLQLYTHNNTPGSISNDTLTTKNIQEDTIRNGFWVSGYGGLNFYSYSEKKFYSYLYNPLHWKVFNNKRYQSVELLQNTLCAFGGTDATIELFDLTNDKHDSINYILDNGTNAPKAIDLTCETSDHIENVFFGSWQNRPLNLNIKTKKYTLLPIRKDNPFSLLESFLHCIYLDDEKNLWFGHGTGISVCNLTGDLYNSYFPMNHLVNDSTFYSTYIYDMIEDKNNGIWIGSDGLGLWKMDSKTKQFVNIKSKNDSLLYNCVFTITATDTNLFVGVRYGLSWLNLKGTVMTRFNGISNDKSFTHRTVYRTFIDSKKRLWLSSVGAGTFLYDIKTKQKKHFDFDIADSTKLSYYFVVNFYEDAKGQLYAFTPTGYSIYHESDSTFRTHSIKKLIPNKALQSEVRKLFFDSHGLMWFYTWDGTVTCYDTISKNVKIFNDANGLLSSQVNDIAEDTHGNIWIAFNVGVMRWHRNDGHLENLNIKYDQPITDFTKILISKNGKVYIANYNSIVELDPEQINLGTKLGKVLLSEFNVFDQIKYFSNNQISLSYRENFFTINYSVPQKVFYNDIQFRYKLEGFNNRWVYGGSETPASFTNVPGGDYVFFAQARIGNQPWEQTENRLNIHISKIFYQTWWFRSIIVLLLMVATFFYLRYKEKIRAKEEAENSLELFSKSVYEQNAVEEILWDVLRNVISRLNFEDCIIYLLDENENILIQKAALGGKNPFGYEIVNPIKIEIGKGIVGAVAKTGKSEIIADTSKDARYITDDEIRYSEIAVPIIFENKVIGVIDSEHHKKNYFTPEHLKLLEEVAAVCAAKIITVKAKLELKEKETQLLEYNKKVAEMSLTALRAQMNPHFVFNCLNSIDNYIITKDAESASRYLNKFAKLIRLILNQSEKMSITLNKEIEMLNYYLEMEALRFDHKFRFEITADVNGMEKEIEIPSMIIQPFTENAVLHGLMHRKGNDGLLKIHFQLTEQSLLCWIEDNGVGRKKSFEITSSKTSLHESKGMKVTEDRLRLLQEQAQQISHVNIIDLMDENGNATGTKVELEIPLLNEWF